jgi:hypothetical protein
MSRQTKTPDKQKACDSQLTQAFYYKFFAKFSKNYLRKPSFSIRER